MLSAYGTLATFVDYSYFHELASVWCSATWDFWTEYSVLWYNGVSITLSASFMLSPSRFYCVFVL